jgi:class 3 adenylate cyclase/tetratricopeptide (TPR) repeat protein
MLGLQRHVPELALDWLEEAPERRWRAIDGSLVFADISGFTALAERLAQRGREGGEELVETLSRVFGAMLDIAAERGGMLLKFGGDALLLFFRGEGHSERACAAAVEMRSALRRAAEIPTSVGPLRLSMSVGVHSGEILFFLVGSAHRELVVLGPGVTATVETESAANAGEIAVSAPTAERLPRDAVKPRADGVLLLRWRTAPNPKGAPAASAAIGGASTRAPEAADALARALFPRTLGGVLAAGAPEPEHRVACMAFVRFSGTDALLAQEGPDAVARALEATVAGAMEALDAEGVTLLAIDIDRDGGKLFLGAGVPFAHEDDEGVMLRALRRIADAKLPLALQMGVNRGHVFAAELGTPRRAAYSAMGDTTNTAARIAGKAPIGALYAHPSVLDFSRTLFDVTPAGPLVLKGKKVPLAVYAVGDELGVRAHEGLDVVRFVGRSAELARLREAIERARAGHGGALGLVSPPGLGKSRLLREALAAAGPIETLALRAEPYGASSPYRMLRDPVRGLLGVARAPLAEMRAALERGVARAGASLAPMLALVGDVAHVEVEPSAEVREIDPRFRPDRVAEVMLQLLAALRPGPTLFVVEDAQWADQASAHLLGRIAAACAERPWLLLSGRRDEATGLLLPEAQELRLAPLGADEMRALVDAATEAAPLRPHEAERVVQRASGNPLFALETIRAARELGSLDAVPESLEAAMAAQVDALDPAARRVLRYASVLGRSFSRASLDDLLRGADQPLDAQTLARLGAFLEPDGEARLRFKSGVVRDAAYGGLAYRSRTQLHRNAGEAIERAAEDPSTVADTLALHFSRAGEHEKSWRYARSAAERARRAYANADAVRLYELALESAPRMASLAPAEHARVWRELGDVRERSGMCEAALGAYRRAARLVHADAVAQADLLLGQARARERVGKFSAALRDLARGRRLLEGLGDQDAGKARAQLLSFAAMVRYGQDRSSQALEVAREAIEEARRAEDPVALGRALQVMDLALLASGGSTNGAHLREALEIFDRLGDLYMGATVLLNLGFVAGHLGEFDEAVSWLRKGEDAHLRSGDAVGAAICAYNLGDILVKQGKLEAARPVLEKAQRVMRASEFMEGALVAEIQLARISIEGGEPDDADAVLERIESEFLAMGKPSSALEATIVRALGRERCGDAETAIGQLDRAAALAGKDAHVLRPQVAYARANALLALGRLDAADEELRTGLRAAAEQGLQYERALLLLLAEAVARRDVRSIDPAELSEAKRLIRQLGAESKLECLRLLPSGE